MDDYVPTTDGTGIVHQAPAYGEDDQRVAAAAGIPTVISADESGRFLPAVTDVAGQLWSDANMALVRLIRSNGRLLRLASYEHSYPHCWRCRNPLIYKAVSSWFVRVTDFKDRMLANNEQITWGARERQARSVRQVAAGCAGLVDQPEPVLGHADPGVAQR